MRRGEKGRNRQKKEKSTFKNRQKKEGVKSMKRNNYKY